MTFNKLYMIIVLLGWSVTHGYAQDAFLVSGETEKAKKSKPIVSIYKYEAESKSLNLIQNYYYPTKDADLGTVVQISSLKEKKIFTIVGTGEIPLIVCKVSGGIKCDEYGLSEHIKESIYPAYLYNEDYLLVKLGNQRISVPLILSSGEIESLHAVDGEKIMPQGSSAQAFTGSQIGLSVDEYGYLHNQWGQKTTFSLKEIAPDIFEQLNRYATLILNSKNYYGLVVGSKVEGYYLYLRDKKSNKWTYSFNEALAYTVPFKDWLIWQEVERVKVGADNVASGSFKFQHLSDHKIFSVFLGKDSEVFDIDEAGWMLYRVNDTLYKAQVRKDSLGKPIKLVTDPAIKTVHWGLWAEKDTIKKVESQTSDNTTMLWWMFGGGVLLLGLIVLLIRKGKG